MTVLPRWVPVDRPAGLAVILLAFMAFLMVLRLTLFPGGSDDDGEILYYAQSWSLAYKTGQPPLYAWLLLAVQSVLGPSIGAVIGLKYALITAFYAFAYLAARRLLADPALAALAPLGLLACYFIGWETLVTYSHTVLAMAAMAASLWLLLRLEDRAGAWDHLWLAFAVAVGLMAKYTFAVFLAALLFAAWRHPGLRPRLLTTPFVLTLGAALVPAGAVLAMTWDGLGQAASAGGLGHADGGRLAATGQGLWQALIASLGLLSPFLPLAVVLQPGAFRPLARPGDRLVNVGRFLEAYLLGLAVIIALAIAVIALPDVRNNWMVVWFPAVFYVLLRLKVYGDSADGAAHGRRARWLATGLMVIAIAVPAGLAGRAAWAPENCRKCTFFIPYATMAERLQAAGFRRGTIVADDRPAQLAGPLRGYFPDSRVLSTRWVDYLPPAPQPGDSGQCLLIWQGDAAAAGAVKARAAQALDIRPPSDVVSVTMELAISGAPGRGRVWSYMLFDAIGDCR